MTWSSVLGGTGRWSVEQADAANWLAALPADSVDLVMTSPPYEDARSYREAGESHLIARKTDAWVAWMVGICEHLRRVCRGLVAIVCQGRTRSYRYTASPFLLMADLHRAGFNLRNPAVYYRHGIPGLAGDGWSNKWEPVVLFSRPGPLPWSDPTATGHPPKYPPGGKLSYRTQDGQRINHKKARAKGGRRGPNDALRKEEAGKPYQQPKRVNPGNVIRCKVGGSHMGAPQASRNEAPFPAALVEPFVRCFCPPGGIVLDPFAGSGTTLAVAVGWGRRAIGCDLRASQVALTCERLATVTPTMFPEN